MSGRIELEGQTARLRPVAPDDAERAFELLHGNRAILDWLEWPGPTSVEDLRQRYANWRVHGGNGDNFMFAIDERAAGPSSIAFSAAGPSSSALSGALSLRFADHPELGLVGYWVDPSRWGRGLATDAVRLASWLAFAHFGAVAVAARVHVGNEASRRVLEKAWFAEVSAAELPDQAGCGARPQWGFRLERAVFDAHSAEFEPVRVVIELTAD